MDTKTGKLYMGDSPQLAKLVQRFGQERFEEIPARYADAFRDRAPKMTGPAERKAAAKSARRKSKKQRRRANQRRKRNRAKDEP